MPGGSKARRAFLFTSGEIHILEAEQPETNGNSFRRTELEIPAEFCGKLLRLSLPDLKWIEWKLDGLDDPYFYE